MDILVAVNNLLIFKYSLHSLSHAAIVLIANVSPVVCFYYYRFLAGLKDNSCVVNVHSYKLHSIPYQYKLNKNHTSYLSKEQ